MQSFWHSLSKGFTVLAPMDDVTDVVFRDIVADVGRPDVFFTEFTNVEGLCSSGYPFVARRLQFTEKQRPLVAQIWGLKPENFYTAAGMIADMGFDGIDINMGCPVRDVIKTGACSAMIDTPSFAKEVIDATIRGAKGIPVSVKTRIGTKKIVTEEWIGFLLEQNIAAITVHGRIAKEMSKFPANWIEIGKAAQLRTAMQKDVIIVGNGDVQTVAEAQEKVEQYGVDGVMIGRGIFSNLWLFHKTPYTPTYNERLRLLIHHIALFEKTWGAKKDFNLMKKFYKVYISDFPDAAMLRLSLMEKSTAQEAIAFLETKLE